MHKLKQIMETLEECVSFELSKGIKNVDVNEMGAAIDMIKDCCEAMYYYSIHEAMEEYDEEEKMYYPRRRDSKGRYMPRKAYDEYGWTLTDGMDKMYWGGDVIREHEHDPREGKSGIHRKSYKESKALGKTEDMTKQELETYMKELGMDIAEIVSSATPAERSMLKQKLTEMASKVQ